MFKKRSVLLKANEKHFDESVQISLKKRAEKEAQKVNLLLDEKIQIQGNLLQIIEQHQERLITEVYKPLDLIAAEPNYQQQSSSIFDDIPEPMIQSAMNKKSSSSASIMKQAQVGNISSSMSSVSSGLGNGDLGIPIDSERISGSLSPSPPKPPILTFSSEMETNQMEVSVSQKISPKKRTSLEDEPPIDPNEPVYCYCKQVSWGEMLACDGLKCPKEWFHLSCVGFKSPPPPEGKWYCNECKK